MIALVVGAVLAVAALIYVLLPLFDAVTPLRARLTGTPAAAPESAIDALLRSLPPTVTNDVHPTDSAERPADESREGSDEGPSEGREAP